MTQKKEEVFYTGVAISEGIAIGKLHLLSKEEVFVPEFSIQYHELDAEITRYRKAISSSREDLQHLQSALSDEGSEEAVSIIDAHIQMLEDPLITTLVEQKIKQKMQNTESVFKSVIGEYEKRFTAIEDAFFKQRLLDVKDLSHRILKHLHAKQTDEYIPANAVVFAKELVPSHTAEACVSKVCAFLSEIGGSTSHAALIARARGIPYVASIKEEFLQAIEGSIVIVDGIEGKVIFNPAVDTLKRYEDLKAKVKEKLQAQEKFKPHETVTKDGFKAAVAANIESLKDFDHPHFSSAEEIGLFRSEFLFLQKEILNSSEEAQYVVYRKLFAKAADMPVVFRVFDIGGDKGFFTKSVQEEPNPALGCRSIRFLLTHKDLFIKQLKALIRGAIGHKVSILLPLISDVSELLSVKKIIKDIEKEFTKANIAFAKNIPIGAMLEVPSAILTSEILAEECDFFSVGTNDLVQYTLAYDRTNPMVEHHYHPAHPSILKLLKMVVDVASKHDKKLTVCGEMASNPLYTKLLLGLGIKNFSCAPRYIPDVQNTIRNIDYEEAKRFAKKILSMKYVEEIEKLLKKNLLEGKPKSV